MCCKCFVGRSPFLSPSQQCQSTEGNLKQTVEYHPLALFFFDSWLLSWQRFLVTVSPMRCLFWTNHFNTITLLFAGYITLIMALCYRGVKMKLTVFPAATDSRFLREVSRLFCDWLLVEWFCFPVILGCAGFLYNGLCPNHSGEPVPGKKLAHSLYLWILFLVLHLNFVIRAFCTH